MRSTLIAFVALAMASACSHGSTSDTTASDETRDADGHLVATTPETSGGHVTACGDAQVFFTSGSSELDDGARERLATYAGCLSRHEIDVVYVSGQTDPSGTEDENLALGRARARAVADFLHEQGTDVDFVIRSYGETAAMDSQPLWPLERSASATAVVTQ